MSYETSYDTGFRPFNHDKHRGKWAHPRDFLYACLGHSIKLDSLLYLPLMVFRELGFYAVLTYIVIMAIAVVPIVFIQSFLGQFSGTGFISVFRIAPLFKGVGYVSLGLNLISLTYYSVYSAIPLMSLFYTLQPTIPWSCEASDKWMDIKANQTSVCLKNISVENIEEFKIPSLEFFRSHLDPTLKNEESQFSWVLLLCTFAVWGVVLFISLRPVETIGRFLKFSFFAIIGVMLLLLLRCLFLPSALIGLHDFFKPYYNRFSEAWFSVGWIALANLGPGWGSILSMASFNHFKASIYSYSWIMGVAQLAILLGLVFISMLMWGFMLQAKEALDVIRLHYYYSYYCEFLIIPTALTMLELPHFWSVIFFLMMILGSLNLMIVQLLSVLTSAFDEFEGLRARKRDVSLGVIGVLALFSIYFCSNHGFDFMEFLAKTSLMTQMLLNLLLILVVLWIYGRERFQRDVNFMTSRIYSLLMTSVVRFVTPLFLLLGLLVGVILAIDHTFEGNYTLFMFVIAAVVTIIPWCLIPWYCIFRLLQTSGVVGQRFGRCVKPTDWYPADALYKQRYEETFSNPEASHQLTMATEEAV